MWELQALLMFQQERADEQLHCPKQNGVRMSKASGNPIVPTGRLVHPFEIADGPTAEAYLLADAAPAPQNNLPTKGGAGSDIRRAGKQESKALDRNIAKGNLDGVHIVNNERIVAAYSNNTGFIEHKHLERGIKASKTDRVDRLGISLEAVENEHAVLTHLMTINPSAPSADEKAKGTLAAPAQQPAPVNAGYQFSDYESMYEVGGGYKTEDYKSMYD